jgi:putative phosphoesterase
MKVLLLSDIHGNYEALAAILAACSDYDRLLCLGDVVGYYGQVNEVVETLIERKAIGVRGNHEQMLKHRALGVSEAVQHGLDLAEHALTGANRAWLEALPLTLGLELAGRTFLLVHGSPWQPVDEYLYPDSAKLGALDEFAYEAICWGHTHREVILRSPEGRWLLNPGSVGQSRTQRGKAMAISLDTETMEPQLLCVPYDIEPVMVATEKFRPAPWARKSLGGQE